MPHMNLRAALRVLVVDADPATCDRTGETLRWDGCEVSMASTAERALELVRSIRPHAIVISASIVLAMGGALRVGAFSRIPVIALSSGDDALAVDAVLRAPVDALELLATVRLLAGGSSVAGR
jgi:DNA-binding response OmpR family regulator